MKTLNKNFFRKNGRNYAECKSWTRTGGEQTIAVLIVRLIFKSLSDAPQFLLFIFQDGKGFKMRKIYLSASSTNDREAEVENKLEEMLLQFAHIEEYLPRRELCKFHDCYPQRKADELIREHSRAALSQSTEILAWIDYLPPKDIQSVRVCEKTFSRYWLIGDEVFCCPASNSWELGFAAGINANVPVEEDQIYIAAFTLRKHGETIHPILRQEVNTVIYGWDALSRYLSLRSPRFR